MTKNFLGQKPRYPESVFLAPGVQIMGEIEIGENSSLWPNVVARADMEKITIGSGTNIQDNSTLHNDFDTPLIIGSNVTVGHSAILHGCQVADNCLIGMSATIMNNARIGEYSIIGAGALIPEDTEIPPGSLVVGLPGKVIRETNAEERQKIEESAETYQKMARQHQKFHRNNRDSPQNK